MAAEWLHADHRADHVAIDIDVADGKPVDHGLYRVIDARVDPERQPVARALDRLQYATELIGGIPYHVKNGAEYFFSQFIGASQFENMRSNIVARGRRAGEM